MGLQRVELLSAVNLSTICLENQVPVGKRKGPQLTPRVFPHERK